MEKNCKECLHNPVCQMWRDQEGQDASSFQLSGCIHFEDRIANGVTIPVRCKDCIHWHEPEGVCLKIYSDGAFSYFAWQDRNPEDFCSYGERRTDERTD